METLRANQKGIIVIGAIFATLVLLYFFLPGSGDDADTGVGGGSSGPQLDMLWTVMDGADAIDQARGAAVDSQGNIVMVGYTGQSFVAKYDSEGTLLWEKPFGPLAAEFYRALSMALDSDDNIFLADHWGNLGRLVKFSPDGDELWSREVTIMTSSNERAWAVDVDSEGNAYVVGGTEGVFPDEPEGPDGNGRSQDVYIAKYDSEGNLIWVDQWSSQVLTLPGSSMLEGVGRDYAQGVVVSGESVYVAGQVDGTLPGETRPNWDGNPQADAFIVKYDLDGNMMWDPRQFGSNRLDEVVGIGADTAGNVYVAGTGGTFVGQPDLVSSRGIYIRKFSPDGEEVWTKQLEGEGGARYSETIRADGMTVAPNGDVYVVGRVSGNLPGNATLGGQDSFVVRYNTDGNLVWSQQFGTDYSDESRGVALDGTESVYVTGQTTGAFSGQVNNGRKDYFIAKFSQDLPTP